MKHPQSGRSGSRGWRPLLTGALAARARAAIDDVARDCRTLRKTARRRRDPTLAGGTAGLAVFYAYLDRALPGGRFSKSALAFLEDAQSAVASFRMTPWLYSGFAGVAWATAHVEAMLLPPDERRSTAEIDEAIRGLVGRPGWRGDYDLVSGLVGLGVYALERMPDPAAAASLTEIVDRLAELAVNTRDGTTWHTPPELLPAWQRREAPEGYFNVGLAHGVPGIVAVLAAAGAAGVRSGRIRRLLPGAVRWLLSRRLASENENHFPAWVVPGTPSCACRSAWCYGSPGVAAALFAAARLTGEREWEAEALDIARAAADRDPDRAGVTDAGLCHGAAGLGHIFNRFYQATGDAAIRRAARYWFDRALAMREPGEGPGGFFALTGREDGGFDRDPSPSLLSGAPGIALALLAATTSIEPAWDRMLLVSAPGPR
ncbi:MAG TPA: lanthionine synthetase C family protein [Thermoanaerobaculia bacterium]